MQSTPTRIPEQMQHADAVAFLTATHRMLARQQDLSPNNTEVNSCLAALVATLRGWQAAGFGADLPGHPDLTAVADGLPRLCAAAEAEMEKWWARKILAEPLSWRAGARGLLVYG